MDEIKNLADPSLDFKDILANLDAAGFKYIITNENIDYQWVVDQYNALPEEVMLFEPAIKTTWDLADILAKQGIYMDFV